MKNIKLNLALSILLILLFKIPTINAQINTADTTLAKNYYLLGDKYYSTQDIDSSNIYYQKAADVCREIAAENNDTLMWAKYVECLYSISWNLTSQSKFEKGAILRERRKLGLDSAPRVPDPGILPHSQPLPDLARFTRRCHHKKFERSPNLGFGGLGLAAKYQPGRAG